MVTTVTLETMATMAVIATKDLRVCKIITMGRIDPTTILFTADRIPRRTIQSTKRTTLQEIIMTDRPLEILTITHHPEILTIGHHQGILTTTHREILTTITLHPETLMVPVLQKTLLYLIILTKHRTANIVKVILILRAKNTTMQIEKELITNDLVPTLKKVLQHHSQGNRTVTRL